MNIQLLCKRSIDFPELAIFASLPGDMINLHWLKLPMARTIFHYPKGVRAIGSTVFKNELVKATRQAVVLKLHTNGVICILHR